ncbi:MAG: type I secretion system permease/ATPase [Pseudomonadota bacterium]
MLSRPETLFSHRGHFASIVIFSVAVNLLMLTGPLFMLQVYDRVLASRSEETLAALFILVAFLYAFMGVLDFARGRVLARIGAQFQTRIAPVVFKQALTDAKDATARGQPAVGLGELDTLKRLTNSSSFLAVFDVPWTPAFLVLIFTFHPLLGWVSVLGGALLVIVALLNTSFTRNRVLAAQTSDEAADSFVDQIRSEAELISAQGMSSSVINRWFKLKCDALEIIQKAADKGGAFTSLGKALRLFLQSALLAVGAYLVLQSQLTAGAMIAASILLGRALAPIEQIIGSWPLLSKSLPAYRSLVKITATAQDEPETSGLMAPDPRLTAKNVTVLVAGRTEPILQNVSFDIKAGEVVGLIGKSGAGKSTIGRALLGVIKPQRGELLLGGVPISQFGPLDIGRTIGYLPQLVGLFPGTIAENIARLDEDLDMHAVQKAAQQAGAHDLIVRLPDGYRTLLGHTDNVLSGGQRQRIGLARALYGDPSVLLLDEPNSALDAEGTEAMNAAIRRFRDERKTVLLMTHRPIAISECSRLIVVDNGKIAADGPRDQVLSQMIKNADKVQQVVRGVGT